MSWKCVCSQHVQIVWLGNVLSLCHVFMASGRVGSFLHVHVVASLAQGLAAQTLLVVCSYLALVADVLPCWGERPAWRHSPTVLANTVLLVSGPPLGRLSGDTLAPPSDRQSPAPRPPPIGALPTSAFDGMLLRSYPNGGLRPHCLPCRMCTACRILAALLCPSALVLWALCSTVLIGCSPALAPCARRGASVCDWAIALRSGCFSHQTPFAIRCGRLGPNFAQ